MKWTYKDPSYGDMIRVAVGSIYHFGIYVSDDEVIQFGLPPSQRERLQDDSVEVLAAPIDKFLAGGFLEVCEFDRKEKKNHRTPEQTVAYARSKIGMRGYHILYNNCEHFANDCISGVKICHIAEDVRAMFRKIPVVDVYIASVPKDMPMGSLGCADRMNEINSISNESVRREKYFVWKLLCYALERTFGMRGEKLCFEKQAYGGWSVNGAEISLSHSAGALAVAVSRGPVGVDIEHVHTPRSERMAERIMTDDELSAFLSLVDGEREDGLIGSWTAKEALFKSKKMSAFVPKEHNTLSESVKTNSLVLDGEKYIWSVATANPERIRVFTNIDLTALK